MSMVVAVPSVQILLWSSIGRQVMLLAIAIAARRDLLGILWK